MPPTAPSTLDGVVRLKRGDTIRLACAAQQDNKTPLNLTGWSVRSQVRTTDYILVAELALQNFNPAAGTFELFAPKSVTVLWPPGQYLCDIEYGAPNGDAVSTKTFSVMVETSVTRL